MSSITPFPVVTAMPSLETAHAVREMLRNSVVFGVSIIGGPQCGKTSLIEQSIAFLKPNVRVGVICGKDAAFAHADNIAGPGGQHAEIPLEENKPLDAVQIAK